MWYKYYLEEGFLRKKVSSEVGPLNVNRNRESLDDCSKTIETT